MICRSIFRVFSDLHSGSPFLQTLSRLVLLSSLSNIPALLVFCCQRLRALGGTDCCMAGIALCYNPAKPKLKLDCACGKRQGLCRLYYHFPGEMPYSPPELTAFPFLFPNSMVQLSAGWKWPAPITYWAARAAAFSELWHFFMDVVRSSPERSPGGQGNFLPSTSCSPPVFSVAGLACTAGALQFCSKHH